MKKYLLIGSLVANVVLAAVLLIPDKKIPSKKHSSASMVTSRQEPVFEAQEDIKRFVDTILPTYRERHQIDFVRAYTISSKDMLEVMGLDTNTICKYTACRAYLGLGEKEFKLYLTPVDAGRRDVFLNFKHKPTREVDESSYVLNLIAPCPNTCDKMSPLYNFRENGASN